MSESFLGTDYTNFDHVGYAREWAIDWNWYDEMVRDWEEEHKPDPDVEDLLGVWGGDHHVAPVATRPDNTADLLGIWGDDEYI